MVIGSRRNARAPRTSQGRKKIEIKGITNKSNQQVTFSKRRKGLFKKASELCILSGAQIAIIIFSPVGKIFCFGHPRVEEVIDRFLHGSISQQDDNDHQRVARAEEILEGSDNNVSALDAASTKALNYDRTMMELEPELELELEKKRAVEIEAEKGKNKSSGFRWEEPFDEEGMVVEELEHHIAAIEELMGRAAMKADDLITRSLLQPYAAGAIPGGSQNFGPYGFFLNQDS